MVIGGIGTILTAGYFLWMLQRVNQGEAPGTWKEHHFRDILAVEWVSWVPLLALDAGARAAPEPDPGHDRHRRRRHRADRDGIAT